MNRSLLIALLLLSAALSLEAKLGAPELEEASDVAGRAAKAAISGPGRMFAEALDIDGMLARRLGETTWQGLTERQRDQLRALVRDHFLQTLASPRGEPADLTWTSAAISPTRNGVDVLIGLQFGPRRLKTRWEVQGTGGSWRVADVILSAPGISLADASFGALRPEPVRPRQRPRRFRSGPERPPYRTRGGQRAGNARRGGEKV